MRRKLVVAFAVLALLGALAPPVFAQAPAPKVTIEGFLDQTTTFQQNMSVYDTDVAKGRDKDKEWYARERGRFQITGEVGKTKGVFLFEHDAQFGTASGRQYGDAAEGCQTGTGRCPFGRGDGSLQTEMGRLEIVWLYTEFPITGSGSLLPMVPVPGTLRVGFQPFDNETFKLGVLAFGNYGGAHADIDVMPGVKFIWTYAQLEKALTGRVDGFIRGDDFATVFALELSPFKGLDVKPLYAYYHASGTADAGDHGPRQARGGVLDVLTAVPGSTAAFALGSQEDRHTIGVDARWKSGPFSVDPTFFYQFGSRDIVPAIASGKKLHGCNLGAGAGGAFSPVSCVNQDISAWLFDVRGGWQAGPLTLEGLFGYISGNEAKEDLRSGRTIHYYQSIANNAVYAYEWGAITAVTLDYLELLNYGNSGIQLSDGPGYDKYGQVRAGVRAKYNVTPDFALKGVLMTLWTAEDVDTRGVTNGSCPPAPGPVFGQAVSQNCNSTGLLPQFVGPTSKGKDNYLGTEINLGFDWNFAPNIAFRTVYGHLFSGSALDNGNARPEKGQGICSSSPLTCTRNSAQDVDVFTAIVRYTF